MMFRLFAKTSVLVLAIALIFSTIVPDQALAQRFNKKKQLEALEKLQAVVKSVTEADDASWRGLDPENTLLMDLPTGLVVIELRPDLAPVNAARIRELVREGFYDGLNFHRVIEGFVAQGGDPKGDGTGGSTKPDIAGEFTKVQNKVNNFTVIGRDRIAAQVGFVDGMKVAGQPKSLANFLTSGESDLWGVHCPGTMSMARATAPDSGNSQFFFVIGDARQSLDSRYSAWGWVVDGLRHSKRISRGEPPTRPTPIVRVRLAADVTPAERPDIQVFKTSDPKFVNYLEKTGRITDGLVRDLCDIKVPVKVDGEVKL